MKAEESILIERLKKGERTAFNELYGIFWAPLVNYAELIVGDENADDVVHFRIRHILGYDQRSRNFNCLTCHVCNPHLLCPPALLLRKCFPQKRHKHIVESITVLPPEKTLSAPVSFVPTQVAGSRFSALLQKSFFLSSKTFFLSSRMQKPLFSRLSARPEFPELFIFSDF